MAMVSGNSKAYIFDSLPCFPKLICGDVLEECLEGGAFIEVGRTNAELYSTDTNVCGVYAFVCLTCVATQRGRCNGVVADIEELGLSQHIRDNAVKRMVASRSRNIFGKTHSMAGGFGDDYVHILPIDKKTLFITQITRNLATK